MDAAGDILLQHFAKQFAEHFRIYGSQHFQHLVKGQFLSQIEGDALIQKTQRVSHGTVSCFRHIAKCFLFHRNLFFLHQFPQPSGDRIDGNTVKIIPLTSGLDRHRNLVGFGGCQNKDHIRRWFFQSF